MGAHLDNDEGIQHFVKLVKPMLNRVFRPRRFMLFRGPRKATDQDVTALYGMALTCIFDYEKVSIYRKKRDNPSPFPFMLRIVGLPKQEGWEPVDGHQEISFEQALMVLPKLME
jgi:hypothetical protein